MNNRGASMVEFALVAPLLFLLLFGIIEFGVIMYDQVALRNASREGARQAALYYVNPATGEATGLCSKPCSEIEPTVNGLLNNRLFSLGGDSAIPSCGNGLAVSCSNEEPQGAVYSVQTNYTYKCLVVHLLTAGFVPEVNLSSTAVMRSERQ